jgi:CelD/BcsL family acetyltransferase involved in cellulose biosynthesis
MLDGADRTKGHINTANMRILRADASCLPDGAEWQSLTNSASEPNPFFEHWFFLPALQHLSDGREIWVAEYRDGGTLSGLFPMAVRTMYGRSPARHVGNWAHYQCFIGNPLIRSGFETTFWQHLLLALDNADWAVGFLSVAGLEENGSAHRGLIEAAKRLDRPCPVVHDQERAMLKSCLTASAYLETHIRPKKRKEWRRLANRLSELGEVSFTTLTRREDLDVWAAEFLALESAGWKGKDGAALSNSAATRGFFLSAIKGAFDAGKLDFQRLSLDGRPIAMLINFMTLPGSWSFKIAYDEGLARFSPGVMIELRNLERTLGNPEVDWMDSCAVENHPMIDSIWAERRRIVQVSVPLTGVRRMATYHLCRAAETASANLKSLVKSNRHG